MYNERKNSFLDLLRNWKGGFLPLILPLFKIATSNNNEHFWGEYDFQPLLEEYLLH